MASFGRTSMMPRALRTEESRFRTVGLSSDEHGGFVSRSSSLASCEDGGGAGGQGIDLMMTRAAPVLYLEVRLMGKTHQCDPFCPPPDTLSASPFAALLLPLVALWPSACGPHPQVTSFNVLPPLVCPGQSAVVKWNVLGRASLRAERGAVDWDEGAVPSEGSRTVVPARTTTFKITALDANPADGSAYGTKLVQIPGPAQNKAVISTCDAASRKCKGSLVLDNGGGPMRALTLSA